MRDPRSHRRYVNLRRAWLNAYGGGTGTCALCGRAVNTALPGTVPLGPTIEHRVPIRVMKQTASDFAELLAMACDTRLWALAHRRCQDRQGAQAVNQQTNRRVARVATARSSRTW